MWTKYESMVWFQPPSTGIIDNALTRKPDFFLNVGIIYHNECQHGTCLLIAIQLLPGTITYKPQMIKNG